MTGSALGDGRCCGGGAKLGRSEEEGGKVHFAGSEGWRMTGRAFSDGRYILRTESSSKGREFEGGRARDFAGWGARRMTGSASTRWTLQCRPRGLYKIGREFEGGEASDPTGPEARRIPFFAFFSVFCGRFFLSSSVPVFPSIFRRFLVIF